MSNSAYVVYAFGTYPRNNCWGQWPRRFSLIFTSKTLNLWYILSLFLYISVYSIRILFHSFMCGYQVFSALFIEEIILSLIVVVPLTRSIHCVCVWLILLLFILLHCFMCIFWLLLLCKIFWNKEVGCL